MMQAHYLWQKKEKEGELGKGSLRLQCELEKVLTSPPIAPHRDRLQKFHNGKKWPDSIAPRSLGFGLGLPKENMAPA